MAALPSLGQYRGKLLSSPQTLADPLETMSQFDKDLTRLYVYAGMLADENTRDGSHQGMKQEMVHVAAAFAAEASYVEPEILRGDKTKLETFIASEPRLAVYRFYIEDIIRRAAHTLSESEEKLLADAGPMAVAASSVYNILSNVDFPYLTVTLGDGRAVKVD